MRSTQNRRGKSARMLTVGEIKRAICTHARLAPGEPSEQPAAGLWETKLTCPDCGAWTIWMTPAGAEIAPVTVAEEQHGAAPAEPAWERCVVELRCQERQARTYPLCRFEAVTTGPAGRSVVGETAEFDNGIGRMERQAVLDTFIAALLTDRWQTEPPAEDGMPHFRRLVVAPVPLART